MQTNGDAGARPRAPTVQGAAGVDAASAAAPASVFVTAVACCTGGAFFAGHTDGVVRAFAITE